tara:strand:+ start:128 stop:1909 length:1782 start_codon:yes stop_codon:yes gene_type:complete
MNIHISRDGQQFGPYTLEDAQAHLASGSLLPHDLAWVDGATEWRPLSEVVAGGAVLPVGGIACPKCQAPLEADQVICMACGYNLDDPAPSTEEIAAAEAAAAAPVSIPMPFSYEDETANRSAFVNSIGWALIIGAILPVIADAGKWSIPLYDIMWFAKLDKLILFKEHIEDVVGGSGLTAEELAEKVKLEAKYKWPTIFGIIAPLVVGVVACVLANIWHGRNRGAVLLGLGLVVLGFGMAVPDAGRFEARAIVEDEKYLSLEPVPTVFLLSESDITFREKPIELTAVKDHMEYVRKSQTDPQVIIRGEKEHTASGGAQPIITACTDAGIPRANIEVTDIRGNEVDKTKIMPVNKYKFGNLFYEKLGFYPSDHPVTLILFALSWIGVIVGMKVRSYRPESIVAYICGLAGGAFTIVLWLVPVVGTMPLMLAVNSLTTGQDYFLGAGLLLMMLFQLGAATCCFLNQRGIRPSLMKKYSNLGATLMLASVMVGFAPVWAKVIYENSNKQTSLAEDRQWYVKSQLGKVYSGFDKKFQQAQLRNLPSPGAARIGSIFGWLIVGLKYIAWIGGLFMLIPLGIIELLCGQREPDGPAFMQ